MRKHFNIQNTHTRQHTTTHTHTKFKYHFGNKHTDQINTSIHLQIHNIRQTSENQAGESEGAPAQDVSTFCPRGCRNKLQTEPSTPLSLLTSASLSPRSVNAQPRYAHSPVAVPRLFEYTFASDYTRGFLYSAPRI